jgi:hypothetical protein
MVGRSANIAVVKDSFLRSCLFTFGVGMLQAGGARIYGIRSKTGRS